jgi:VanZ family protein
MSRIKSFLRHNPHARRRIVLFILLCFPFTILFSLLPGFHPDDYVSTHYNIPGDLWVHTGSYFLISLVAFVLFSFNRTWVYASFALLLVFSIALEVIQYFIPERGFSLLDILSNVTGIAICMIIAEGYYLLQRMRKTRWQNRDIV